MKRLRIGVDIDGVIDDLSPGINRAVKRDLGIDLEEIVIKDAIRNYRLEDWPEVKQIPGSGKYVAGLFNGEEIYRFARPIAGAIETLNVWRETGHRIWVITARPPHLAELTAAWLRSHDLGWLVSEGRVVFNEAGNGYSPDGKPGVIDRLKIQVFLEDNAETLRKSVAPSIFIKLLFVRPWNTGQKIDSRTALVRSWQEAAARVKEVTG